MAAVTGPKSFFLDEALHDYLVGHGSPPDAVLERLRVETESLGDVAAMQVAPEQGALLRLLARLVAPRFAVEVGTFTGYSALCIARGMPPEGRLLCCDVSTEWTDVARRHWDAAGVADRIALEIGPAAETLRALPDRPTIDLAFIDADKRGYPVYYEEILRRLSPRGVILVDNVLWGGAVLGEGDENPDTVAIREFNDALAADDRVDVVMLAVSDGLTLATRRH